jgi:hypothetical protein
LNNVFVHFFFNKIRPSFLFEIFSQQKRCIVFVGVLVDDKLWKNQKTKTKTRKHQHKYNFIGVLPNKIL